MLSAFALISCVLVDTKDYSLCVDQGKVYAFGWKEQQIQQLFPTTKTIAIPFALSRRCQIRTVGQIQYLFSRTDDLVHFKANKAAWKQLKLKGVVSGEVVYNGCLYLSTLESAKNLLGSYTNRVFEIKDGRIRNQWQTLSSLASGVVPVFISGTGDLCRVNTEGRVPVVRARNTMIMKPERRGEILPLTASSDWILLQNYQKCTYVSLQNSKDVASGVSRVGYSGSNADANQIWAYGEKGNEMLLERWQNGTRATMKIDADSRTFRFLLINKSRVCLGLREPAEREVRLKLIEFKKGKLEAQTLFKEPGLIASYQTAFLEKVLYVWTWEKGKQMYKFP